jgi:membrane associated rhomboid family serine protease
LGASGIVFMMILLASFTNFRKGEIPLTFILVLIFYVGNEVMSAFRNDGVARFAHILGGFCGSIFGFFRKPASASGFKPASGPDKGAQ